MLETKRLLNHYDKKYHYEMSNNIQTQSFFYKYPSNRYEACIKYFLQHFNGCNILEIGAGSGVIANAFIENKINFNSYTLTEFSNVRLQALRNRFKNDSKIKIIKFDADNPKYYKEIGQYDAVILIAVIEHLIDPLMALKNIRIIIKSGCFLYIDTPNIAKFTRRIKLVFGRFPSTASKNEGLTTYNNKPVDLYDEGHFHCFTFRSLSLMLTQRCGFSKVKKNPYPLGFKMFSGRKFDYFLAQIWPEMFSELSLIAYV